MTDEKKPISTTSDVPAAPVKKKKMRSSSGHRVKGTRKKFFRDYPGQDPVILKIPKPVPDPEAIAPVVDEASQHKYPPPRVHPIFRKIWMEFIDNICARENFKVGHLNSLEILCDLYVEYDELRAFLRQHGRSYQSLGRSGQVWKPFPEVAQLNLVQSNIKEYTKMLGLLLKKDHSSLSGGEKDEWE